MMMMRNMVKMMTMVIITLLMMTITMMTRRECEALVGALAAGGLPLPWVNSLQYTAMHRLTVQRNGSMHICKCSICMHARCESDMHIGAGCKGETLATPLVPMLTPLLTPWCTWSTSTRIFTGISTGALGDPPGAHLPHNLLNSHCH